MNRAAELKSQSLIRPWVEGLSWAVAAGVILTWSAFPAWRAVVATFTLKPVSRESIVQGSENVRLEIQRSLQKHFLDYGIYVPLEDIVFTQYVSQTNADLESIVKKVCGSAPLVMWVPLQFKLPLIGERSVEWCWKPSLKN
jgi:hypothetical protein